MLLSGGLVAVAGVYLPADTWVLGTTPIPTPEITSVTVGNSLATVVWTPAALGPGVIVADYLVTAEPVGPTVEVVGTDDSAEVTGLVDGDSYEFTVQPTNQWGTYPSSAPSSPPLTPLGVPGAPTGVSGSAGDQSATIEWTPPAPSPADGGVTGYAITGAPQGPVYAGADATSVVVTGLTDGDGYIFSVAAESDYGTGPLSAMVVVYPYSPLGSPTSLSAVPGSHSVTLSWSPPAPVSGVPVVGYTVSYGGSSYPLGDVTSAVVTGLVNGDSYRFWVYADAATGEGQPAVSGLVTPVGPPDAVEGSTAIGADGEIAVNWAPSSLDRLGWATGFDLGLWSGGTEITSQVANRYQTDAYFQNITDGIEYIVTITPFNSYGYGPTSSVDPVVYGQLGAPTAVGVTSFGTDLSVAWSPPTGTGGQTITGYTVKTSPGTTLTVGASASSVMVSGLTPGARYSFTVAAFSAEGAGTSSAAVKATFPAVTPGIPQGVAATPGNAWVTVSWLPPSSNGGDAIRSYAVSVYQCVPKSSPCTEKLLRKVSVAATTRMYAISSLTNGRQYFFTVTARTKAGAGDASAKVTATPVA
jgi:titin